MVARGCCCRIEAGTCGVTLPSTVFFTAVASLIGYAADDRVRFQNLANRHRNGRRRHGFEGGKPTFAKLLPTAGVVELDHEVRFFGGEVGRRIVEGQVAVFADADERHIDRMLLNQFAEAEAFSGRIPFGIQIVKCPRLLRQAIDEPFLQILTKRRGMRLSAWRHIRRDERRRPLSNRYWRSEPIRAFELRAPVATITWATPRSAIAAWICSAPAAAARLPSSFLMAQISIFIAGPRLALCRANQHPSFRKQRGHFSSADAES